MSVCKVHSVRCRGRHERRNKEVRWPSIVYKNTQATKSSISRQDLSKSCHSRIGVKSLYFSLYLKSMREIFAASNGLHSPTAEKLHLC